MQLDPTFELTPADIEFLEAQQDGEHESEIFDFTTGEDCIFEVIGPGMDRKCERGFWKDHQIEDFYVLANHGTTGALSYDQSYGTGVKHILESMLYPHEVHGPGVYVIEEVTCYFTRGDGWMTDDDVDFDYRLVRPATIEETFNGDIFPLVNFWASELENVA